MPVTKNFPYKENSSLVNHLTESNALAPCDTSNAPVVLHINDTIAPDAINTHVLTKLLPDNLPIPESPWPEVHPFPATLPIPINTPANALLVALGTRLTPPIGINVCENPSKGIHFEEVNKPAKNGTWSTRSLSDILLCVNALNKPDAPTAFPQLRKCANEETPSITPPATAAPGVNTTAV
tara:strand:- start:184 stop:726 length:543 start_codon:yes stop_codon:yes gene_type:complete